jgi:hypothetical protein
MDTQILLTSGQVAGRTETNPMRLYHYVKDFPEYFSESARKHTRGRRWTPADVEIVLSIKSLYHGRMGKENIKQLLSQGWRMESDSFYGREALDTLLEAAQVYESNATEMIKKTQTLNFQAETMLKTIRQDHEALVAMRKQFSELQLDFYNLQKEVRTKRYSLFGPKDNGMHR